MLFNGLGVAMVTPMNENGAINLSVTQRLIEFLILNGADAIIALGTTGEAATISQQEKSDFLRFVVEKVNKRVKVIAGTGSNCTEIAVKQSIMAQKCGTDGVLVVTPYYNKCTENGLYAHYRAISENIDLPIIAYNVPKRTGFNITPKMALGLCEIEHVLAIKEASGSMEQIIETIRLVNGRMSVYCGDDALTVCTRVLGGAGVISVVGNVVPSLMKSVVSSSDISSAARVQLSLNPLINSLFSEVNPVPIKAAMSLIGFDCGSLRLPLTKASDLTVERIKNDLKELNII